MSHQHSHLLPTIVALSQTTKETQAPYYRLRRKTDASSSSGSSSGSGTTLVPSHEPEPEPELSLSASSRPAYRKHSAEFSNTPPLSPSFGLDDAYFGMAYSQRYRRQGHDSKPSITSRAQAHTYHYSERRARHVQLETERFPLITKAAHKMADILNIKKTFFLNPWSADRKDGLGEQSIEYLGYYLPSSDKVIKRRRLPSPPTTGTAAHDAALSSTGPFVANADPGYVHRVRAASHDKSTNGIASAENTGGFGYRRRSSSIDSCTLPIKGSAVHQKRRPQLVVIERVGDMYVVKPQHRSCKN
ncbi:hypothetical protein FB645_002240 [Coemansia sp. IMI 203386]|nr:hypothetical protein FB645_002240 [Coemansia sp. IMI 203386]